MKKIIGLVHTRFSSVGGVENYINKLVPSLLEKNWQIHYFTAKIKQKVPQGMIVHKIPVIKGSSILRMLSFAYGARKAVLRTGLPLVMGFGRTIYQDIYRDGSGCFLDYESHSTKRFNRLYRKSYLHLEKKRFFDPGLKKIITVSRMVKDQIINRYHIPSEKIKVVYSGVDSRRLNPDLKKQKGAFRKELKILQDSLVILFIGNGFERKGLSHLIMAVSRLPEQIPVTVLVAGEEKKINYYKKLAQNKGCIDRFRFLGYYKNVQVLYGASDLFVLPSFFDPIANVVLESLYTGTPVITGQAVGASELIENGKNGFVVFDYLPETLTSAILSYWNSSEKNMMSAMAHNAASAYRWLDHVKLMEELFIETMEKKRHDGKKTG